MTKALLRRRARVTRWLVTGGMLTTAVLMVSWICAPAWGATGGRVSFPIPTPTPSRPSGLRLDIESHWVESAGYRPVWITVSSVGRAVADRHLTIRLAPGDWSPRQSVTEFKITLPQGAPVVRQEVAVPQQSIWQQFEVTTYEEGREVEDLSGTVGLARTAASWMWTEAYPTMLFIDADAPRSEQHSTILAHSTFDDRHQLPNILALRHLIAPLDSYSQGLTQGPFVAGEEEDDEGPPEKAPDDSRILDVVQKLQMVALLPPEELPAEWLNYTCLDLIFISLSDARAMNRAQPDRWQAMLQHVRAGGNLIVFGAGGDFVGLTEVDQLLAASQNGSSAETKSSETSADEWRRLKDSTFGHDLAALGSPTQLVRNYQGGTVTIEELSNDVDRDGDGDVDDDDAALLQKPPERQDLFRVRSFGWGRILAAGPPALDEIEQYHWAWALNDIGPDRWRWYRRYGLSRQRFNPGFWDFLIPGVGAAPVRTFLAMITGFMIVIGPVNYFFLNRSRRLYLLLVTVPLGSAVIIASLFAFAILKDGLGTRARLRSFSQLTPDGSVTSWSRQSYYAGLVPSSGLVYPRDAAVFPIEFDGQQNQWRRRLMRWGDEQQFASGYLAARTTFQNLVIHTAQGTTPIELQRAADEPPRATNTGSIPIKQLLIRDEDESFWLDDLAPGAAAQAQRLTPAEADERYARLLRDHAPTTPQGFTAPNSRFNYGFYSNNFDSSIGAPDFQSNLLEDAIGRPMGRNKVSGRMYFAVTEQAPPWIAIGVKRSRAVAGFHVIQGSW